MYRKLCAIASLPLCLWQMVISHLPGPAGYALRYRFWRKRLRGLGKGCSIGTNVHFENPAYIEIGDNCWIDHNVIILAGPDTVDREKILKTNEHFSGMPGVVHIGCNVHIGPAVLISGISAGVYISDDCCVTGYCRLYALTHHYRSERDPSNARMSFDSQVSPDRQCVISGPIHLGENTAVALGSTILPGVCIMEDCFVAINSVVRSGVFQRNSVIRGSPADIVGERFKSHD